MEIYQHDSVTRFDFVLRGELIGESVLDLEHAWRTAGSILGSKQLVVDVAGVTKADHAGVDLLARMRESGARLKAALSPGSRDFIRSLGIPAAAPQPRH